MIRTPQDLTDMKIGDLVYRRDFNNITTYKIENKNENFIYFSDNKTPITVMASTGIIIHSIKHNLANHIVNRVTHEILQEYKFDCTIGRLKLKMEQLYMIFSKSQYVNVKHNRKTTSALNTLMKFIKAKLPENCGRVAILNRFYFISNKLFETEMKYPKDFKLVNKMESHFNALLSLATKEGKQHIKDFYGFWWEEKQPPESSH